jgi:hypothetical protein
MHSSRSMTEGDAMADTLTLAIAAAFVLWWLYTRDTRGGRSRP